MHDEPKTIEEIHQEANNEKQEKDEMVRQWVKSSSPSAGTPPSTWGVQGRGESLGSGGGGAYPVEWTVVGPQKRRNQNLGTSMMANVRGHGTWSSMGRGGGASKSHEVERVSTNRYAALVELK